MEKDLHVGTLLDIYSGYLTEKQEDVLRLYYDEDFSLTEISELYGITRQGILDTIKRGEKQLKAVEDKLHMAAKAAQNEQKLKYITKLAQEIIKINSKTIISEDTLRRAKKIISVIETMEL